MGRDRQEVNLLHVAMELHKFPHEVEALPCDEYDNICAFLVYRQREEAKAHKKAKGKSKGR